MTEQVSEYETLKEGATTYTELKKYFDGFKSVKLFANGHKDDPLQRDVNNLLLRLNEEREERKDAFVKWYYDRTEENAINLINEFSDESLFIEFLVGVVAGYTSLIRK